MNIDIEEVINNIFKCTDHKYVTERVVDLLRAQAEALKHYTAIIEAAGDEDPVKMIEAAKRLPLTADGVRHDGIYALFGWIKKHDGTAGEVHSQCWGTRRKWEVARCYSTREAAEAAREEGGAS